MEKNLENLTEKGFIELLENHKVQQNRVDALKDAGFDLYDSPIIEYGNFLFEKVLSIYFNESGRDWIYWWLYEKDGNPEFKAWDKNKKEVPLETYHDLWEFVKQYLNF